MGESIPGLDEMRAVLTGSRTVVFERQAGGKTMVRVPVKILGLLGGRELSNRLQHHVRRLTCCMSPDSRLGTGRSWGPL